MDPNRFQQYLIEKLKILNEFLSVSESMKKSLDLPAMGEVVQGIAKRQEMITRLNRMDDEIRTIARKSFLDEGKWAEGLRKEILLLSQAIEEVLHAVKTLDKQCQERIEVFRDEVRAELQKAFQEMLTIRSYFGKPAGPPKFLDVRR